MSFQSEEDVCDDPCEVCTHCPEMEEWWEWKHGADDDSWMPPEIEDVKLHLHDSSEWCPCAVDPVLAKFRIDTLADATVNDGLHGVDVALSVKVPDVLSKGPPSVVDHDITFWNETFDNIGFHLVVDGITVSEGAALNC